MNTLNKKKEKNSITYNSLYTKHHISGSTRVALRESFSEYQKLHREFPQGSTGKAIENAVEFFDEIKGDPEERSLKALNETCYIVNNTNPQLWYKKGILDHYKLQKIETKSHHDHMVSENYNQLARLSSKAPVAVRTLASIAISHDFVKDRAIYLNKPMSDKQQKDLEKIMLFGMD